MISGFFVENIKFAIDGRMELGKTYTAKMAGAKQRELQYHIDPIPQTSSGRTTMVRNITIPIFCWKLDLRRKLYPYILKAFTPMTVTVVTSWISFLIPPENIPGRAGILVTLLLVLTTFHLHELDESPSVGGLTALVIWGTICLVMIILAFLEYACILYAMRFGKKSNGTTMKNKCNLMFLRRETSSMNKQTSNKVLSTETEEAIGKNANDKGVRNMDIRELNECQRRATQFDYNALIIIPALFITVALIFWIYYFFLL